MESAIPNPRYRSVDLARAKVIQDRLGIEAVVIGRAHSSMNAFFVLPSHDKLDFSARLCRTFVPPPTAVPAELNQTHLRGFAAIFGERYASMVDRKRFVVFGDPSNELRSPLDKYEATYHRPFGRFAYWG